ncbi:hypothetical protein TrispH2_005553 [Trichoplax sp. H2]|nr:hypothetical protein TrispH2_005553 [Trichoplax sp. H2]|eukprot:RDD41176.1 hypothetical protein TrispH2_005553 [Trichoplax sp. H2]
MNKYDSLSRKFSLPELPDIKRKTDRSDRDDIWINSKNKSAMANESTKDTHTKDVMYWKPTLSHVQKGHRGEDHDAYISSKNARKGTVFLSQSKHITWKDILRNGNEHERTRKKYRSSWKNRNLYPALPTLNDTKPKVRYRSNITRCYANATEVVPATEKNWTTPSFYNEDLSSRRQLDHKLHRIESACLNNSGQKRGLYCDVMGSELCEKCIEITRRYNSIEVHRQLYPKININCDSLCRNHALKQFFSESDSQIYIADGNKIAPSRLSNQSKQRLMESATPDSFYDKQSKSPGIRDRISTLSESIDLRTIRLDPPFLSINMPLSASDIAMDY